MSIAVAALLALSLLSLALTAVTQIAAWNKLRSPPPPLLRRPAVSVLKPLKGLDDGLYDNLESIVVQDYGPLEIVLGAEDPNDPALAVARQLQAAHPDRRIVVLPGAPRIGLNPKVSLLAALTRCASHELLLVSDSNVRVDPGYLADLVAEIECPGVGLVSSLLAGDGETSFGALCESLHFNTFVAAAVAGSDVLARHPCVVGKSMLLRRTDLERLGGWTGVNDVLAEDYLLGVRFARAGHRVALSAHVVGVRNGHRTLRDFAARQLRWGQMRRRIAFFAYLGEPLLNPLPWLLASAAAVSIAEGLRATALVGLALAAKVAADLALGCRLRGHRYSAAALLALPVKDVLMVGVWAVGLFRRSVEWRGNRFRVGAGSALEPLGGAAEPPRAAPLAEVL